MDGRRAPDPSTLLQARQRQAGPGYALRPVGSDHATARSAAQRMSLRFFSDAVDIAFDHGGSLRPQLAALGRRDALERPPAVNEPRFDGYEARYRRGAALSEWYLNGPFGLEQRFDLSERVAAAGRWP